MDKIGKNAVFIGLLYSSCPSCESCLSIPAFFCLPAYKARPDKGYSLTDCISMNLMRERDITEILTHDHHFTPVYDFAVMRAATKKKHQRKSVAKMDSCQARGVRGENEYEPDRPHHF